MATAAQWRTDFSGTWCVLLPVGWGGSTAIGDTVEVHSAKGARRTVAIADRAFDPKLRAWVGYETWQPHLHPVATLHVLHGDSWAIEVAEQDRFPGAGGRLLETLKAQNVDVNGVSEQPGDGGRHAGVLVISGSGSDHRVEHVLRVHGRVNVQLAYASVA